MGNGTLGGVQPSAAPPGPPPASRSFRVSGADAGTRLDAFLAARLCVSRAEARRLLLGGGVSLDGRPVGGGQKGTPVAEGSRVAVGRFTPPAERRPRPEPDAPLGVLGRGPGWIAVDKPAGVPVHPFREEETGCMLNRLVAREPGVVGVGEDGLRSGVVHRLDVDTSGVLIFATEEACWRRLRRAFATAAVRKRYRAIVEGRLQGEGELELALVVAQHRPARVRVARAGEERRARTTRLAWRSLEAGSAASLVEVRPRTGFLHQIRASLAQLGHPVVGDAAYGASSDAPRQMLHAAEASWRDVRASSPDPEDFRRCWADAVGGTP